jgi:3-oxoadipate enol-lactonase
VSVPLHHVADGPEGAPVLLLGSSLGTSVALWDGVVPALAEHLRVLRFDLRGQGASPVPRGPYEIAGLGGDVIALLDDLGIASAAYCGVSLGGMVGLWLAAHAPERIDRLVACCTSAHPAGAGAWAERAATVTAAGGTAPIADAVVAGWTTEAFAARRPDVAGALRAMLLASPAAGYAACCGLLEGLDLRPCLGRIGAPTLVLAGAQDAALGPEHGALIARGVPGARLELLDPAAHLPMAERPEAVGELILEHLEVPA